MGGPRRSRAARRRTSWRPWASAIRMRRKRTRRAVRKKSQDSSKEPGILSRIGKTRVGEGDLRFNSLIGGSRNCVKHPERIINEKGDGQGFYKSEYSLLFPHIVRTLSSQRRLRLPEIRSAFTRTTLTGHMQLFHHPLSIGFHWTRFLA